DVKPAVADSAGWRVYHWRWTNLAIDTTRTTLQKREGIEITTFRSWRDLGAWYGDLERPRETVTPAIQAKAQDLVKGRRTLTDSIAALFTFVSDHIRYVALNFGVGRFQPRTAADVLANEYGDCKDKHVLLAALLHVIGVPSAPVLINTVRDPDSAVVSPSEFDHVITLVPMAKDTLWLDATPDVAPFQFLWYELRGRRALVIPASGAARLGRAPRNLPFAPTEDITMRGGLTGGTIALGVRFSERGDGEVLLREVFRTLPRSSWPAMAARLDDNLPGPGTTSDLDAARPEDTDSAFWMTFRLTQSNALTWKDSRAGYQPPLPAMSFGLDDSTADTAHIDVLMHQARRLVLGLPAGITANLPIAISIDRDYADYRSTYTLRGDSVEVLRTLDIKAPFVLKSRRDDFRAFRRTVRNDEAQLIGLIGTAAAVAATPGPKADVDELVRRGNNSYQSGDARGAADLFGQALAADPKNQYAWNDLGRAYLDLRMLDSAASAFRRQIALNPFDQYAYNNLGLAQWRSNDLPGAASSFRKEIEVNPLDQYAHSNLGQVDLLLKVDSEAARELAKAAVITPGDANVHANWGRALVRVRQADSAVAEFDRAISMAPARPYPMVAARALSDGGVRLDKAEVYAHAALDAATASLRNAGEEPNRLDGATFSIGFAWDQLGWILFREGKNAEAERYENAAWSLTHQGSVGDHLAQVYQKEGKRSLAIRTYALVLNAHNTPTDTRQRLTTLVGSTRMADQYGDSARTWLMNDRTIDLHRGGPEGTAMLRILTTPHGVTKIEVVNGSPDFKTLSPAIERAHLPVVFPDTATLTLPVRALLACSSERCLLTVTEPQFITPVIQQ
ncbi:MAG TPA: tetratricopeptide repeat protein, partial [Gemmatimonadales bacterium]|nr:tetratricopeptide repeat protein [Gemmatimonadales bacterium]